MSSVEVGGGTASGETADGGEVAGGGDRTDDGRGGVGDEIAVYALGQDIATHG